jgi:hypothetical protein
MKIASSVLRGGYGGGVARMVPSIGFLSIPPLKM